MNTALIAGLALNTGILLSALSPAGAVPLTARALVWLGTAGVAKWGLGVFKLNGYEKKLASSNASGKKK